MTTVHIHLLLNHVPIFITFFSILFIIWGTIFKKNEIFKIGLIGFIIGAIFVIPVFFSGQESEEIVEKIPGISEHFLDSHEEFAEVSLWLTLVLGVLGIIGFIRDRLPHSINKLFVTILLVFSIITAGSLTYTAYLGGNIRHTELQQTPQNQQNNANGTNQDSDDIFSP
ncbi:MAG TPA: hypothetical protein VKA34_04410 [Balneolales bacterium]|nr:hypothetical protein [Balneolales bacterium]